jgi:hypothetical protein
LANTVSTTESIAAQIMQGKLLSIKIVLWLDRLNQSKLTPPYKSFTSKETLQHVTSVSLLWYESIDIGSTGTLTQQRLNHLAEFPNSCTAAVLELLACYALNSDANIDLVFEFERKGFMTKNLKNRLWGNKAFIKPEQFSSEFASMLWRKYKSIAQRHTDIRQFEAQVLDEFGLAQEPQQEILHEIQDSFTFPTLSISCTNFF